ncbi:hypothetical protein BY458DRAFT_183648 [Sporodiniella umbellata]|nr:hypothetical protein BY458DRAFT_183648 [Sporodiniella umbellata]
MLVKGFLFLYFFLARCTEINKLYTCTFCSFLFLLNTHNSLFMLKLRSINVVHFEYKLKDCLLIFTIYFS